MTLRDALNSELVAAMQRRDRPVTAALRTTLAALANAEAVPTESPAVSTMGTPHIAGATAGLGATEAPRRDLTEDHERAIVARERAELLSHADRLTRLCRRDEADAARRAAATLSDVLGSEAS